MVKKMKKLNDAELIRHNAKKIQKDYLKLRTKHSEFEALNIIVMAISDACTKTKLIRSKQDILDQVVDCLMQSATIKNELVLFAKKNMYNKDN
jgi:hypothetical protein